MVTETLAFLCEMPKLYDLGHVRDYVIRMLKLPKIAKIDSIRLVVLYPTLYSYMLVPKY